MSVTATPTASPTALVPQVVAANPDNGDSNGGWTLQVDGANFLDGAQVVIDGTAYSATYVSATQLQLVAPALAAGTRTLSVLNPGNVPSSSSASIVIAGPVATDTPTPSVSDGPLHVLGASFHPHPVRGDAINLKFKLDGPADRVVLKVYSRAMVVVARYEAAGSYQNGWNQARFDSAGLGAGTWFCTLQAQQGSKLSLRAAPIRLFKLP